MPSVTMVTISRWPKISQKILKHVLANFAPMLFNLFPIKLHGDLTMFNPPFFACPIKILKREQKIFIILSLDFYTSCIFSGSHSSCALYFLLSCRSFCTHFIINGKGSPVINVEMNSCIENTHFELLIYTGNQDIGILFNFVPLNASF